ncbi:MAG: polysaccharide biosynthesis tyrosine autokinase [Sphingomonadales bacterium]|nr:polysaccharide biosynthesis tyrosine autokinase [Sphingomonadales bacterium]
MNNIRNMNSDPSNFTVGESSSGYFEGTPLLIEYWKAIFRHKIAIIIIIISFLFLGVIATLMMTPYYTSTSRIEINRDQDRVTNVDGLQAENAGQNLEFYETQYSLLKARSLAERVVRAERLATGNRFFETFNFDIDEEGIFTDDSSGNASRKSGADQQKRLKIASDILLENVSIAPIRGSSLVDIQFRSPSAKLSADIANSWVREFIASNLDRRFSSTADARKFLEDQLATLKSRLEDSERQLATYADDKQIVTLSAQQTADGKTIGQRTLATSSLEELNVVLAAAIAERIAAENELRQGGNNRASLANTVLNNLREERAAAQAEYDKLMVQFEPGYPIAKALASKISSLSSSIRNEENRSSSGITAKYREALGRESQLRSEVQRLKAQFAGERRDAIQYGILQREVDTNRQLYDGLLQRYKEIGVAGVGSNNISTVDNAETADKPSSPNLILNMVLSLMAGFGFAALYVFLRHQIDQSIRDPADVTTRLGMVSLGAIPDFDKLDVNTMLGDKKSVAWDAYLSVCTSLSFLTDHGVPKSFILTSTRPNEGKSTSALFLAAVLARGNKKVLLIDADMRNPSLHQFEGYANKAGLSNFLAGADLSSDLIMPNEKHGFDMMLAGPIPPNSAELLSSDRMSDLITRISKIYDIVIVDGPPVLGLADIPLLASAVEGVVYTVESGGVKARAIQSSVARVRSSGATVFGVIVTKIERESVDYGYAYEYSYGERTPTSKAAALD